MPREAWKAIEKEVENLLHKKAAKVHSAKPKSQVEKESPDTIFVPGRTAPGLEGDEVKSEDGKEYKGRFVAGGHNVKDAIGMEIIGNVNQIAPATLPEIRIGMAHGSMSADGISLRGHGADRAVGAVD